MSGGAILGTMAGWLATLAEARNKCPLPHVLELNDLLQQFIPALDELLDRIGRVIHGHLLTVLCTVSILPR